MRRATGLLATVASVAALAGCASAPSAPAPPSRADALAFAQEMLDGTFSSLKIDGSKLPASDTLLSYDDWNIGMSSCLSASHVENASVGWSNSAWKLYTYDGQSPDAEDSRLFYLCLVTNSLDARSIGALHSDSERAYLWRYYRHWVMPCLAARGVEVQFVPSRDDFMRQSMYQWTPYDAVDFEKLVERLSYFDRSDPYAALADACGAPFGAIEQ